MADANLVYQPWRDDAMEVIARCGHPLSKKRKIYVAMLGDYSLVLREEGSDTILMIELYAFNQLTLHSEITLSKFEAFKRYVARSDGLSCVSSAALYKGNEDGLCVLQVKELMFRRPLSLVVNEQK